MQSTDIRNEQYLAIEPHLREMQLKVLGALLDRGPSTTRQLADYSRIDLLNVRPRMTDLLELGLVKLVGRLPEGGIYEAKTVAEIERERRAETETAARGIQGELF